MTATISEKIPKIVPTKSVMVKVGNDEIWFDKVKGNDAKAFEYLFKSYYTILTNYAFSMLKDKDDAEEIVQAVFVKLWENRVDTAIETSFKSYIYQSVKNRCLNHLRNTKTRQGHLTVINDRSLEVDSTSNEMAASEIRDKMYEALEALPPQCKKIFQLSRLQGLKHKEIADMMGLKAKTVENQIGIGLKLLRHHLAELLSLFIFLFFNK